MKNFEQETESDNHLGSPRIDVSAKTDKFHKSKEKIAKFSLLPSKNGLADGVK